jgi:exopolysaccharide production protein ExoZ
MGKNKLKLIQMYRGVAAILVVMLHVSTGFYKYSNNGYKFMEYIFEPGWSGVDFFFCLSGFIIFSTNYKNFGNGLKVKSFILARIIRIYPLVWLINTIFLLACVSGLYTGPKIDLATILHSYAIVPLPFGRLIVASAWTLSFELFFYFIFGLCLYFKSRYYKLILICQVVFIVINYFVQSDSFLLTFILNYHNLEFVMGVFAAILLVEGKLNKYGSLILSIGVVLFLFAWYFAYTHVIKEHSSGVVVFGIVFTLIIIGSVVLENNYSLKIPTVLTFLGDASYSIYLVHLPFLSFMIKRLLMHFEPSAILAILLIIGLILLGVATYSFVEKPIMIYLKRKLI